MSKAVCKLGLEGIVSKKLNPPYKSGPSKAWLKIKNPKAPAATRAVNGMSCECRSPCGAPKTTEAGDVRIGLGSSLDDRRTFNSLRGGPIPCRIMSQLHPKAPRPAYLSCCFFSERKS
jgi:hypothetical protein